MRTLLLSLLILSFSSSNAFAILYFLDEDVEINCQIQGKVISAEETVIGASPWSTEESTNVRLDLEVLQSTPVVDDEIHIKRCRKFKTGKKIRVQSKRERDFINPQMKITDGMTVQGNLIITKKDKEHFTNLEIIDVISDQ